MAESANTINENDIEWKEQSVFSNSSEWDLDRASIDEGVMTISSGGSAYLYADFEGTLRGDYAKLITRLSCLDHTMTTDNAKNVIVSVNIDYVGKSPRRFNFFPSYVFEDNFTKDYVLFALTNDEISTITVEIHNYENETVQILATGLYLSKTTDDKIKETADEIYDYIDEHGGGGGGTGDFIVPAVTSYLDMYALPEGAMRLVVGQVAEDFVHDDNNESSV